MSREGCKRILIVGLGQIGFSNAEYMASKGLSIDGYDIDDKAIQRAINHGIIRSKATDFRSYDYYIICISTHQPRDMSMPTMNGLFDIARRIAREGKSGALVSIESTVTRGACNRIKDILGHRLHVAHFPHRYYALEKEEHGVRQVRVLGGCEPCCTSKAVQFYGELLDIPIHQVSFIEYAELSKIVENSYRFFEIAFAEELKMVCDSYGLNFAELRSAVNSKWNIKLLEARAGIGGHCLPKDSQMYLEIATGVLGNSVINAAKIIDEQYKLQLAHDSEKLGVKAKQRLDILHSSFTVRKSQIQVKH